MYIITSVDDTSRHNIRLARILNELGLKATFFLNTGGIGREMTPGDVKQLSEWNEIGAHGVSHKSLTNLSKSEISYEIIASKNYLEKLTRKSITSFAYPYGFYNKTVINILQECGFQCGRTIAMFHTNINYPFKIGVTCVTDPITVKYFMIHHTKRFFEDSKHIKHLINLRALLTLTLKDPASLGRWDILIKKILAHLESFRHENMMFHLLIHADNIARRNEWDRLKEILTLLSLKSDNVTLGEAVRFFRRI